MTSHTCLGGTDQGGFAFLCSLLRILAVLNGYLSWSTLVFTPPSYGIVELRTTVEWASIRINNGAVKLVERPGIRWWI